MSNIKFTYLYRDAGNYKHWASTVFSNPEETPLIDIDASLRKAFLPDGLFIARQIQIAEVFPFVHGEATSDDHCFHEFAGVEPTRSVPDDEHRRSIAELISTVEQASAEGWATFDPHDSKPASACDVGGAHATSHS